VKKSTFKWLVLTCSSASRTGLGSSVN